MVAPYLAAVQSALSAERLRRYQQPQGGDFETIVAYLWNCQLCETLYQSLGSLEIVLRNCLHDTLTAHFSSDHWYDLPGILLQNELDQIHAARAKIRKAKKAELRLGLDPITPGRVVANLTFGFWTSILDSAYGESNRGPRFWNRSDNLLVNVFPHADIYYRSYRSRLHGRFNDLRLLRNRVSHYEPILNGIQFSANRQVSIVDLHDQIIESIGWMNPTFQSTVEEFDRFRHVYAYGRRSIRNRLRNHLGT
jgi:hypothetical protein